MFSGDFFFFFGLSWLPLSAGLGLAGLVAAVFLPFLLAAGALDGFFDVLEALDDPVAFLVVFFFVTFFLEVFFEGDADDALLDFFAT